MIYSVSKKELLQRLKQESFVAGGIRFQSPSRRQILAARVALGWSQQLLADNAGVGIASVYRLEALPEDAEPVEHLRPSTIRRIVEALEAAGIDFLYFEAPERLGVSFPRLP